MPDPNDNSHSHIVVDSETVAKLRGLGEPLEFRDEAGNVLGTFQPDEKSPAFRAWLRSLDHGLSEEEWRRRVASRDGLSTEEVVSQLRGHNQ
jgi:hypothetical protein